MPAKQKVKYAGLELEVMPIGEERGIYFTDERPKFRLIITNLTKKRISGKLIWFYGFGVGGPANKTFGDVEFDLSQGETVEKEIMGRLLGFQGNGVIGIPTPPEKTLIESENPEEIVLKPASEEMTRFHTLYTFTIMDKEFYRRVYEHPVRIQRTLTLILITLAGLSISTTILVAYRNFSEIDAIVALIILVVVALFMVVSMKLMPKISSSRRSKTS